MRLGLIVPSSNTTMETEFRRMLPKDFSIHTTRLRLRLAIKEELASMEEKIEEEAIKLADADVAVIGYGCTTGSLFKGLGHDKIIEERIQSVTGKAAVSTAGAVINTIQFLGFKKVAVATPYIDELNLLEKKFFEENRIEVVDIKGLGIAENLKIGRLDYQTIKDLVAKLNYKNADCIFLSCTNLPTIDCLAEMEEKYKTMVFSSNTATLWAMLRKCNARIKIKGFGSLLEKFM